MRLAILTVLLAWSLNGCAWLGRDDAPVLTPAFLAADEAAQLLATEDEFVRALTPVDRSVRMRSAKPIDTKDFLAHASQQALAWSSEEQALFQELLAELGPLLRSKNVPLRGAIELLKTTGEEESHAAYVRGGAIVFPVSMLQKPRESLRAILIHELFHVMIVQRPSLRESLYPIVGFQRCDTLTLPSSLSTRRITNPDAYANDWCMPVKLDGQPRAVYPLLISPQDRYVAASGRSLFDYAILRLLVAEPNAGGWRMLMQNEKPVLMDPVEVPEYFRNMGQNTEYIIHPEEALAENFVLWINDVDDVLTPEILQKMEAVFR